MLDENVIGYNLRAMYKEKQRQATHSRYTLHPRYQKDDLWVNAARLCIEMGMNPQDFMDAIFDYGKNERNIYPNMLAGKHARAACMLWKKMNTQSKDLVGAVMKSSSVPVASPKSAEKDEDEGEPQDQTTRDLDLKLDVFYALQRLKNATGTSDINEANLQLLRAPYFTVQPYIRILLAPQDESVFMRYHDKACVLVSANPGLREAMRKIGVNWEELFTKETPDNG